MTSKEFANCKHTLLPTLRRPGDPPPRIMQHGRSLLGEGQFTGNLKDLLKRNAHRGSVLVRGFRLYHIKLVDNDGWGDWGGQNAWKAMFHMVVAHPPTTEGSTKWIYECANLPPNEEDIGLPYIFVPSSRAHAELTDEDALSNKWVMGHVVGGNKHFCEMVIMDQKLRGRRHSVIGLSPEAVVSRRSQKCYLMPGFETWHRAREIHDPVDSVAESMGFPIVDIDSFLDMDDLDEVKMAIADNAEALVDGLETLTLQMAMTAQRKHEEITAEEMMAQLFVHYDKQRMRIEKRQSDMMDKELARMGYLAQGSGQGTL